MNLTANKNDLSRSKADDPNAQVEGENQGNESTLPEDSLAGEKAEAKSRTSSSESTRPVPYLGWASILQRQESHKQGFRVADREKQVQRANHLVERMKGEMGKMPVERNKAGLEVKF